MEHIAVLLTLPETAPAVLKAAEKTKEAFRIASLDLLHIRPDVDPDLMPTEEVYTEDRRAAFEAERDDICAALKKIAAPWREKGFPALHQERGRREDVAKRVLPSADLVVLGSPHADPDAKILLETVLFDLRKATLLASRNIPAQIGRHIAIAWEPCEASQRAAEAARPLIQNAHEVTILNGGHGEDFPVSPSLELNVTVQSTNAKIHMRDFKLNGRHIGEALLAEAHAAGADMLIMGAFTHSRLREAIFGGATAEILKAFDLPVLMHH